METHTFTLKIDKIKLRKFARGSDCLRCMIQSNEYKVDKKLNTITTLKMLYKNDWIDSMVYFDRQGNLYEYITNIFGDSVNKFSPSEYKIKFKNKL